jgi:hypothetical protein
MRKLIIIAASVMALAIPAAGMAAVSYNDASVGSAGKGDIQTLFGWDNGTFQTNAKSGAIKFTSLYQMDNNALAWTCSDGNVHKWTLRTIQSRTLVATPVWNGNHTQILGYDLGGIDFAQGGAFVRGEYPNGQSPFTCPVGSPTSYYVPQTPAEQFVNTVLPGVQVTYNGTTYDLPNTPTA